MNAAGGRSPGSTPGKASSFSPKWKLVDPSWKLLTQRYDGINNSPRK